VHSGTYWAVLNVAALHRQPQAREIRQAGAVLNNRRAMIVEDEEKNKDTKKMLLDFQAELAKKEKGVRVMSKQMAHEVLAKETAILLRVGGHPLTTLDFKCNT
jgi:hypothetical protein